MTFKDWIKDMAKDMTAEDWVIVITMIAAGLILNVWLVYIALTGGAYG